MSVHALDGDPHYALRDQHAVPLSIVNAVVAYKAAAAANERFDGIHFDNEPYLLRTGAIRGGASNCSRTTST